MRIQSWLVASISAFVVLSPAGAEPPRGLYCSCPPTRPGSPEGSVLADVAELPFVDGVLVRINWADVQPSEGVFDFSLIDQQIARIETYGKKISLAIVGGPQSPPWLADAGAEMFQYEFNGMTQSIPIPWDEVYLDKWHGLVDAVGAAYTDEDAISLVYITHSSANGFEMQLPFSPFDQINWTQAGYTADLLVDAWVSTIGAFASAFPDHPLALDTHPVLQSDEVGERVAAHADEAYGGRVGILGAWWTEHNAIDVYPGMFEILREASIRSHSAVQVARSYTLMPDAFESEGLAGALDLALCSGIRYAEVWNSDLLNEDLHAMLAERAERLRRPFGDVNLDGRADVEDLHAWSASPTDLDCDGDIDGEDGALLMARLRAREIEDMTNGRR
ncbi:MAG: beta-galactosidase [Phycisphaerales bacterium JB059]